MRNLKLTLAYDGTRYRGWQRLPGEDNTIQGKLETALSRILDEPVEISGSGRTDAGAHALGQVASFHCENPMACGDLLAQLRRYLPGDIGVLSCEEAAPRFHARLNATGKTYLYRVWNSGAPCVFQRKYVYLMDTPLNLPAMERAASYLMGAHDFHSFCSNKHLKKSSVRTIYSLDIRREGPEVRFYVRGDGFLYNMVRILVGTLLEVGAGRRRPEEMEAILNARSREAAGETAPPSGLFLMEVTYQ